MAKLGSAGYHTPYENLHYTKTGRVIIEQATKKIEFLNAKIEERQERITKLCEETGLTMETIRAMMMASALSNSERLTAGQAAMLIEEYRQIDAEQRELRRLKTITKHLHPDEKFELSQDEVRSLWFEE